MKTSTFIIIAALLVAATVLAQQTNQAKVISELASKNCLDQSEIIQRKMQKLNGEIKKGTKKFTAEELKTLELKLQETRETLIKLESSK